MAGFGVNPGAYLARGNRFAQLLQSMPDPNNGTLAGGVGSALQKALLGAMAGREQADTEGARDTMKQAMEAMQGRPASTIQWNQPTRPDGTGEATTAIPAVAPNRSLAMQLLASNERTAPMGYQMALKQMEQEAAAAQAAQAHERALALKAAPGWEKPKDPVPGRDVPYAPEVAAQLTDIAGAKAAATRPPPTDYAPNPAGGVSFVPGGPADPNVIAQAERVKKAAAASVKKEEMFPKAQSALKSMESKSELVMGTIDKALGQISPWSTGYGAYAFSKLPGTDARDLQNTLDTIRANVGFDQLQQMRENSPTGGALGSVTENENKLLQAVQGSLDPLQSVDQLKSNLAQIKQLYADVLAERQRAFQLDYGAMLQPKQAAPATGQQPVIEYDYIPGRGLVPRGGNNGGR